MNWLILAQYVSFYFENHSRKGCLTNPLSMTSRRFVLTRVFLHRDKSAWLSVPRTLSLQADEPRAAHAPRDTHRGTRLQPRREANTEKRIGVALQYVGQQKESSSAAEERHRDIRVKGHWPPAESGWVFLSQPSVYYDSLYDCWKSLCHWYERVGSL